MMASLARNWFVAGLLGAVGLAFVFPGPGANEGWLRPGVTTKLAVAVIFFFQGLVLPREALRMGLASWRLHAFVQLFVFLLFPLLGLVFDASLGSVLPVELRHGFLFLAVLPTTISSAIALTALADGNTSGALLNCTLSNLLGVVLTPLWISVLLEVRGQAVATLPLVRGMVLLVILPLVAGQIARLGGRSWADPRSGLLRNLSSVLILYLVYASFCNSVQSGLWNRHGWLSVGGGVGGALVLLVLSMGLAVLLARAAGLKRADQTAAMFCGTQKTLAAGVPLAKLVFAGQAGLGMILVPLMFYHPLQLLAGGVMVGWLRRRTHEENA